MATGVSLVFARAGGLSSLVHLLHQERTGRRPSSESDSCVCVVASFRAALRTLWSA